GLGRDFGDRLGDRLRSRAHALARPRAGHSRSPGGAGFSTAHAVGARRHRGWATLGSSSQTSDTPARVTDRRPITPAPEPTGARPVRARYESRHGRQGAPGVRTKPTQATRAEAVARRR